TASNRPTRPRTSSFISRDGPHGMSCVRRICRGGASGTRERRPGDRHPRRRPGPRNVRAEGRGAGRRGNRRGAGRRRVSHGAAAREVSGGDELYRRTGQWVDGRYLLSMFARLRRDDAGRAASAATIAGAKDHLYRLLTGRLATDPSTAAGYGCFDLATGAWASDLLSVSFGPEPAVRRPSLPAVEPTASSSPLTSDAAGRLALPPGLPVWLGGA